MRKKAGRRRFPVASRAAAFSGFAEQMFQESRGFKFTGLTKSKRQRIQPFQIVRKSHYAIMGTTVDNSQQMSDFVNCDFRGTIIGLLPIFTLGPEQGNDGCFSSQL
jgi:hypothetical protein